MPLGLLCGKAASRCGLFASDGLWTTRGHLGEREGTREFESVKERPHNKGEEKSLDRMGKGSVEVETGREGESGRSESEKRGVMSPWESIGRREGGGKRWVSGV